MKRYYLRLRVESPVSISSHENRDGQTTPTLEYIPGSTLRGALAWHWLRRNPTLATNQTFKQILDQGLLHCGPLYPDNNSKLVTWGLAHIVPTTARTCKHRPGFRTDPYTKGESPHGVRDSLVALIEEEALDRWQKQNTPNVNATIKGLRTFEHCPHCDSATDRFGGFYEWTAKGATGHPNYWRTSSSKRLITRSAILPKLESTAPNNLYSREVLEEGQHLAGWLYVDDSIEAWMHATFSSNILEKREVFSVGAGRTAGLGQVRVIACDAKSAMWTTLYGDAEDRMTALTEMLPPLIRQQWCLAPMTLLSDAILMDANLRYASALTPEVLTAYLNLEARATDAPSLPLPTGLNLFVAAASTRRIAGWNTAQGGKRPRSDDWAVAAGSVFVLAADPDQQAELFRLCRWLEETGIGERREDGYGQIMAAHPFHSLKEEV